MKPWIEVFVTEYLQNGQNGAAAYHEARPEINPKSAKVGACKLLKRVEVQRAIQERLAETRQIATAEEIVVTRSIATRNAQRIMEKAEKSDRLDTALKANDQISRLHGLYDMSEPDTTKYVTLIQNIFGVNVADRLDGVIDVER